MKKTLIFFASLALVALIFSSCKTHERCPAYGKTPVKTEHKSA